MTIRIFNPDHDLALAADRERFTAPHAGRQLRSDLGFLPSLWADDGDVIVVEDIDFAESTYRKLKVAGKKNVEFATMLQLENILKDENYNVSMDVWGWNASLRFQLLTAGVPEKLLPTKDDVAEIRRLSGRQMTTSLIRQLREGIEEKTCGESVCCTTEQEVYAMMAKYGQCVLKAPWSSSGRGVKYIVENEEERHLQNTMNWMRNVLEQQGGVMVEPLYDKVKDFAMEFHADGNGNVEYCGLSLFETVNGAYTGNLLATESEKREILSRYIDTELLDSIAQRICNNVETGPYRGPFGVDMMLVRKEMREAGNAKCLLNPCVEINLRRTMGHVALSLSPKIEGYQGVMNISYIGKQYHLKLTTNPID